MKASNWSMTATPFLAICLSAMIAGAPAVVRALRTNPVTLLRAE
jgi:ABC-type antimicrobial peptide transport system permease subunit